jgi:hypothetical protein
VRQQAQPHHQPVLVDDDLEIGRALRAVHRHAVPSIARHLVVVARGAHARDVADLLNDATQQLGDGGIRHCGRHLSVAHGARSRAILRHDGLCEGVGDFFGRSGGAHLRRRK